MQNNENMAEFNEKASVADSEDEAARRARRRARMEQMRRKKRQQELMRRFFVPGAIVVVACVALVVAGIGKLVKGHSVNAQESAGDKEVSYALNVNISGCDVPDAVTDSVASGFEKVSSLIVRTVGGASFEPPLYAAVDTETASFDSVPDSGVVSENGVVINVAEGRILAQRGAYERINPASMTKILTILVAAEHITDLNDSFEITIDITDYSYINDCSNTGFEVGELVTVRDLFYGTILPSGADSAVGLATYVAGSHEAFVELMNEKLSELGLSETTHFTNCVGLYDDHHYSTVYDMAVILKAACDNSFCREVLSAHTYTTTATMQHPEGITLSNWFLRRIEDKETPGEVLCAKTGYVVQSKNCAASLCVGNDGKEYICVTAGSTSSWRCIYDHVALYNQFLPLSG